MCADDRHQAIAFQKVAHCFIRVNVGNAPHVVVHKVLRGTFFAKIPNRVRPQYVAHVPGLWRLTESIQLQNASDNVTGADGKESDDVTWLTSRMSSIVCKSGDIPPCTQKYRSEMIVTRGSVQNDWRQAS